MGRDWQTIHQRLEAWQHPDEASSPNDATILEARARILARTASAPSDADQVLELLTFALGETRLGVPVQDTLEIVTVMDCTPVPGTPPHLLGLFNLRGAIGALFDVRSLLGHPVPPFEPGCFGIVMGHDKPEFALRIDAMGEIQPVQRSEVLALPEARREGREFLHGVTKEGLIVLYGEVLLEDRRLFVGRAPRSGEPDTRQVGE